MPSQGESGLLYVMFSLHAGENSFDLVQLCFSALGHTAKKLKF